MSLCCPAPVAPCSSLLGTALRIGVVVAAGALAYGALNKAGVIGKKKEEEQPAAGKNNKNGKKK